nr:hypothetical protein GCM10020092_096460 [Actinoplanes digitatis]
MGIQRGRTRLGNLAEAQQFIARVARQGRATADGGTPGRGGEHSAPAMHPDDVRLAEIMRRRDQLGAEPPTFNIAANDAAYGIHGAHTEGRHGPGIPLPRDPGRQTIEGRIYGDSPWRNPENWSYRWSDPSTMNRTVNDYVERNWDRIRDDLALEGAHDSSFDAGHRVGQGYYNDGMYGAGPRNSHYSETSFVKVRIRLVPGADPPELFILTAFPQGIM